MIVDLQRSTVTIYLNKWLKIGKIRRQGGFGGENKKGKGAYEIRCGSGSMGRHGDHER